MRDSISALTCGGLFFVAILVLAFTGCDSALSDSGGDGSGDGGDQVSDGATNGDTNTVADDNANGVADSDTDDVADGNADGDTNGIVGGDTNGIADGDTNGVIRDDICTSDADCDDGFFCTGADTCDIATGACQPGTSPCAIGETCAEDADECVPLQVDGLKTVEQNLRDCGQRLHQILSSPPGPNTSGPNLNDAVNIINAIADELAVLEGQAASVIDDFVDAHLKASSGPMKPVVDALEDVQGVAEEIAEAVDQFLQSAPPNSVASELGDALVYVRARLRELAKYYDVYYYRRHIPIRFVQFVDDPSHGLSDELLQHNINVTNKIFRPTRMRFFLRESFVVQNSEFTDLYLRDASGAYILDAQGHRQHVDYTWPLDIPTSPLIWPLLWPDRVSCGRFFVRPAGNTEHRYDAQMRAGTYCCSDQEVLVYINQGPSNGGQYPWYSRIIGMSSYHMHRPGSSGNRTTFAHEIGHYLALPHTFPSHKHYGMDYDLARIVDPPPDDDPPEGRRIYETHANLVNPETGQTAEFSLFWDLVFKPGCGTTAHMFFNSRQEAAQYELELQPIEQWHNGHFCVPYDGLCDNVSAPLTRLKLTITAGCAGPAGFYGDCFFGYGLFPCVCPAEVAYTGDPRVAAFSAFGETPDKIQVNVMSYGYNMADGSDAPDIIETAFLSASQLEQVDRALTHDVETKYFPGEYGLRPKLGDCTYCHDLTVP